MRRTASDPITRPEPNLRERILRAAAELISREGRDAATTRGVARAAGVQPPAIYRIFGDKRGLLDATAEHAMTAYVAAKAAATPHPDPMEELRRGWDTHVAFGIRHPEIFAIMADRRGCDAPSAAVVAGTELLHRRVRAIARAGRLTVTEEAAVAMLHAACTGAVLTSIEGGVAGFDLSAAAREATLAAITTEDAQGRDDPLVRAATTLRASLGDMPQLSKGERMLMEEILDRVRGDDPRGAR